MASEQALREALQEMVWAVAGRQSDDEPNVYADYDRLCELLGNARKALAQHPASAQGGECLDCAYNPGLCDTHDTPAGATVEAYLVERISGTGYGPQRSIVDAQKYNPAGKAFWVNEDAQRRHKVTPLSALAQAAPGDDEDAWREGWALAYSGADHLYGDDGELQDNRWPMIDWRRDTAMEIRRKIEERGNRALAATPQPGDDAAGGS
jgi:hypothetical protein